MLERPGIYSTLFANAVYVGSSRNLVGPLVNSNHLLEHGWPDLVIAAVDCNDVLTEDLARTAERLMAREVERHGVLRLANRNASPGRRGGQQVDHRRMVSRIESRHRVVLCHDTGLLSTLMLGAADVRLKLPPVDAKLIRRAIQSGTGERIHRLAEGEIAGLDFPALLLTLRSGSTPRECRDRLSRASGFATQRPGSTSDGSTVEALPLAGEVADWAQDIVNQLKSVAAGTMPASELRHAVLCGPRGTGKP